MKKFFSKKIILLLSLCTLSLLVLLTPLRIISLPIILVLAALTLPLFGKLQTVTMGTLFYFLVFTCLLQIEGVIFWLLHARLTWSWSIAPFAIGLGLYILLKRPVVSRIGIWDKNDLTALLISLFSISVITVSMLNGGPLSQQLIRYFTDGFDNTAHLSLTLSTYNESGYIYGPINNTADKLVYRNLSAYPQGWHLSTSTLWHGISNDLDIKESTTKVLLLFYLTVMLWYGLAVFFITRLLLDIAERLRPANFRKPPIYISSFVIMSALQLMVLVSILKFGFVNYLALITYLVAITLSSLWFESSETKNRQASLLFFGLLLSAGATFTWLLAAPIGFLIVLLTFITSFKNPFKDVIAWIPKHPLIILGSFILLAMSCLQGIIQIRYSVIPGNINADGGMWTLNYILFSMMLIGLIIWIISRGLLFNNISRPILISLISFGIISGFINFYQFYTAGKSSYYSVKMSTLLFIILVVFLGGILINEFGKLSLSHGKLLISSLIVSLVFVVPLVSNANMQDLRFANGTDRKLSPYSASQITGLINQKEAFQNNVFIFKELDYEEDIISSHFVNMLSRKSPDCVQHFIWHKIATQRDAALSDILACSNENTNTNYYVIVSAKNAAEITNFFKNQRNVKVMLSN